MYHIIITTLSAILALLGIISAFLPIPGGIILAILGLALLAYHSPRAQRLIQKLRSHSTWLNNHFNRIEKRLGKRLNIIRKVLEKTRPFTND